MGTKTTAKPEPHAARQRALAAFRKSSKNLVFLSRHLQPPDQAREKEIADRLRFITNEYIYNGSDPDISARLFNEENALISESSRIRFSSLEAYSMLLDAAQRRGLDGLMVGQTKQKLRVSKECPYLLVPFQSLAALDAILSLFSTPEYKEQWESGVRYALDVILHRHDLNGVGDVHIGAWVSSKCLHDDARLELTARGMFFMHAADAFVKTLENWGSIRIAVLKERVFILPDEKAKLAENLRAVGQMFGCE